MNLISENLNSCAALMNTGLILGVQQLLHLLFWTVPVPLKQHRLESFCTRWKLGGRTFHSVSGFFIGRDKIELMTGKQQCVC